MCGIFGIIDSKEINIDNFNNSLLKLKHRGPDNQSSIKINKNIAFGHVRLSIIDLSNNNNQPYNYKNKYFLIFNGEIFNYVEIKDLLVKKGYKFRTSGDTEVLLYSYIEWGENCVNKFNGMWSFAIYDKQKNKLFCSRDRFGIKPFYYYHKDNIFYFSSEIKSILNYNTKLKSPNEKIIYNFLYNNLGSECEQTWFKEIKRLSPSSNLIFQSNNLSVTKYWDYPHKDNSFDDFKTSKIKVKSLMDESVNLRLRSDVPVSTTLSSGLDSNIITSLVSKLSNSKFETFTVFSDQKMFNKNEKKYYKNNAVLDESILVKEEFSNYNVNPNFLKLDHKGYLQKLKKCIYHLESGHSSTALVSALKIYEGAKERNIKVILEGQGADELFGGYIDETYLMTLSKYLVNFRFICFFKLIISLFRSKPLKELLKIEINKLSRYNFFNSLKNLILRNNITTKKYALIDDKLTSNYFVNKHKKGLVNLLSYADALSMSCGIESRLPFMDYKLVEYASGLKYEYKINQTTGKYILRESLKQIIPKKVYESKVKLGFTTPIDKFLKSENQFKKILYKDSNLSLIDNTKKNILLNRYFSGNFKNSEFIYKILTIIIWENTFINSK